VACNDWSSRIGFFRADVNSRFDFVRFGITRDGRYRGVCDDDDDDDGRKHRLTVTCDTVSIYATRRLT